MTSIKIIRKSEYINRCIKYKIMINGENAGKIENGQTLEVPIQPGSYELYVKLAWYRSNKINLTLAKGEQAQFRCRYRGKWYNAFHALYYIYFKFDRFFILEKVDGLG
jgi:hypothetical protein